MMLNGMLHPTASALSPRRALTLTAILALTIARCAPAPEVRPEPAKAKTVTPTIAHDFLDMEKDFGATPAHHAVVDRLIEKARAVITLRPGYTEAQAVETMTAIDRLLKDEGYRFEKSFLLHRGLDRKTIDCDGYCVLYTAVAERLRIPFIPVYAPNHSFLRFTLADGATLNWETTQGTVQPEEYYIKTLRIPAVSAQQGVYLQSLTRKEFLAVEFNTIGAFLITERRYAAAIPYFNSALKLYPQFSSAWHNRGTAYYALKQLAEARADLTRANGLDPSRAATHNTLADIHFDQKEYDAAVHEYAVSIKLDPTNFAPYNSIGIIMKLQGKEEKARTWLDKARDIKARYSR